MASDYPGAIDGPAATHADIEDSVLAVQTELGVNPSGAAATVVARLAALDTTVAEKVDPTELETALEAERTSQSATYLSINAGPGLTEGATKAELDAAVLGAGGTVGDFVTYVGTTATPITNEAQARPAVDGPVYWLMAAGVTPNNTLSGDLVFTDGVLSAVVQTLTQGDGILLDNTDPENPIVSAGVWVWNGSAYVLQGAERFYGPVDPVTAGFTVGDGDEWVAP